MRGAGGELGGELGPQQVHPHLGHQLGGAGVEHVAKHLTDEAYAAPVAELDGVDIGDILDHPQVAPQHQHHVDGGERAQRHQHGGLPRPLGHPRLRQLVALAEHQLAVEGQHLPIAVALVELGQPGLIPLAPHVATTLGQPFAEGLPLPDPLMGQQIFCPRAHILTPLEGAQAQPLAPHYAGGPRRHQRRSRQPGAPPERGGEELIVKKGAILAQREQTDRPQPPRQQPMAAARFDDEGTLHLGEIVQLVEALEARLLQPLGRCGRSLLLGHRQGRLKDHLTLQRWPLFYLIVHRIVLLKTVSRVRRRQPARAAHRLFEVIPEQKLQRRIEPDMGQRLMGAHGHGAKRLKIKALAVPPLRRRNMGRHLPGEEQQRLTAQAGAADGGELAAMGHPLAHLGRLDGGERQALGGDPLETGLTTAAAHQMLEQGDHGPMLFGGDVISLARHKQQLVDTGREESPPPVALAVGKALHDAGDGLLHVAKAGRPGVEGLQAVHQHDLAIEAGKVLLIKTLHQMLLVLLEALPEGGVEGAIGGLAVRHLPHPGDKLQHGGTGILPRQDEAAGLNEV